MNAMMNTFVNTMMGDVARWFAHGSVDAVLPMQRTSLRHIQRTQNQAAKPQISTSPDQIGQAEVTHNFVASYAHNSRPQTRFDSNYFRAPQGLMPHVRVVQVREPGQARTSVGRMVMSGRMADVCAELDRLVAKEGQAVRETALH